MSLPPDSIHAIVARMTTTGRSVPPHRVVALMVDDISPLDLGAVAEVFGIDRGLTMRWYELSLCGVRRGSICTRGGLRLQVEHGLTELTSADTIVVPPVTKYMTERPPPRLLDALSAAHSRGARIVSVCLGAFVVAAAGLLDDRPATTHWRYCSQLASRHPKVNVVPDVLYVDDGDVLSSGGVAAGIDLFLHIVRSDHGTAIANQLARRMVVGPHREGGQAQFVDHPVAIGNDRNLGRTLTWALEHLHEGLTVVSLAAHANLSPRSFYRAFHDSTGTTPYRWLLSQRVEHARQLLETTALTIDEVTRRVGFGDTSTMRKHFAAVVGTSPSAYRQAFGEPATALASHLGTSSQCIAESGPRQTA